MYSLEASQAAGLIDEVVDPESLMTAVSEKAQDLATMGHPSYSMTKELFIAEPMSKINAAMEELNKKS
jgi:enoyl-CoA hydratase